MTLLQFAGLLLVWLVCCGFILTLTWREFRRVRFNFNVFFSMLFLLTFFFGFPLTSLLVFAFDVEVVPRSICYRRCCRQAVFMLSTTSPTKRVCVHAIAPRRVRHLPLIALKRT